MKSLTLIVATALVVTACSEPAQHGYDNFQLEATEMELPAEAIAMSAPADRVESATARYAPGSASYYAAVGPQAAGGQDGEDPAAAPMLIRTGTARVEVDSLDLAISRVRELAEEHGGYVGNVTVTSGAANRRTATLQIKVPAGRFDGLLAAVDLLGDVRSLNVSAEDVGEEFVDVQARLANSRRMEERLLALLDRPGSDLEDVLAAERELARVREQAERLEGRVRFLQSRAALATLEVTALEPGAVMGGDRPLRRAFREAGSNLVGVTAALIAVTGGLIPIALLIAAGTWIAFRIHRRYWPDAS